MNDDLTYTFDVEVAEIGRDGGGPFVGFKLPRHYLNRYTRPGRSEEESPIKRVRVGETINIALVVNPAAYIDVNVNDAPKEGVAA